MKLLLYLEFRLDHSSCFVYFPLAALPKLGYKCNNDGWEKSERNGSLRLFLTTPMELLGKERNSIAVTWLECLIKKRLILVAVKLCRPSGTTTRWQQLKSRSLWQSSALQSRSLINPSRWIFVWLRVKNFFVCGFILQLITSLDPSERLFGIKSIRLPKQNNFDEPIVQHASQKHAHNVIALWRVGKFHSLTRNRKIPFSFCGVGDRNKINFRSFVFFNKRNP